VRVYPLPVKVGTRATPSSPLSPGSSTVSSPAPLSPSSTTTSPASSGPDTPPAAADGSSPTADAGRPGVTRDRANTEPCAVVHWLDPSSGAMKHTFYFVAVGDSRAAPETDTQEAWESFETVWADADYAARMLAFGEDGRVVVKALEDARRSGVDI